MLMCNWFSYVCLLHSMKGTEEEVLSPCTLIHAQLKTEKRVPQKPSPRPMCTRSADDEDSACQLLRVEQGFTENRLLLPCLAQRLSHVRFAEKVPLDACGSQCQVLWLPHGCPCKIFEVDRNKIVRAEKPFPKMMLQIPQILSLGMFWFLITYGSPVHPRTTAYHLCWSEDHFFRWKWKIFFGKEINSGVGSHCLHLQVNIGGKDVALNAVIHFSATLRYKLIWFFFPALFPERSCVDLCLLGFLIVFSWDQNSRSSWGNE